MYLPHKIPEDGINYTSTRGEMIYDIVLVSKVIMLLIYTRVFNGKLQEWKRKPDQDKHVNKEKLIMQSIRRLESKTMECLTRSTLENVHTRLKK